MGEIFIPRIFCPVPMIIIYRAYGDLYCTGEISNARVAELGEIFVQQMLNFGCTVFATL